MAKITLKKFHRYIGLLIAVQLLLWTVSGIYFSFNKIENVRGEQYRVSKTETLKVDSLKLEKLDLESAMQIIEEETILQPQTIEIIEEPKRGSEYRGRNLPLYKAASLSKEGKEITEDLIAAAINDATRKVDDKKKEALGGMAGNFKIPPDFKFPF